MIVLTIAIRVGVATTAFFSWPFVTRYVLYGSTGLDGT